MKIELAENRGEADPEEGILACWNKNSGSETDPESGMPANEEVVMRVD